MSEPTGILPVDKPEGPTTHRKSFGMIASSIESSALTAESPTPNCFET